MKRLNTGLSGIRRRGLLIWRRICSGLGGSWEHLRLVLGPSSMGRESRLVGVGPGYSAWSARSQGFTKKAQPVCRVSLRAELASNLKTKTPFRSAGPIHI